MRPKEKPPKIKMTVHPYVSQLGFNRFINFQHFDSNSNLILSVKINTDLLSMILKIDYFLLVESYGLFWKNEINKLWILRPNSLILNPHSFHGLFFQRKVDDSHSLGSASDSGRGGSDDELNTSRNHNSSGVYTPIITGGWIQNFFPWKRGRG